MPFQLDEIDYAILKALMQDGRMPYRQISKQVGVSTPTVDARIKRMIQTGLIKRFVPELDPNKIESGITAIMTLRASPGNVEEIANTLGELEEVRNICVTTGDADLTVHVAVENPQRFHEFLRDKIAKFQHATLVSTSIVTKVIKDENVATIKPGLMVHLKCDWCGGDIKGEPLILRVSKQERYLCCRGCLASYKEKYQERMQGLSR